jgi:hypothetical protein
VAFFCSHALFLFLFKNKLKIDSSSSSSFSIEVSFGAQHFKCLSHFSLEEGNRSCGCNEESIQCRACIELRCFFDPVEWRAATSSNWRSLLTYKLSKTISYLKSGKTKG